MKMDYINIKEKLPEKGKDVQYIDINGDTGYAFRCNCHNPDCKEWRDVITGYHMMINVVKWKYC